MTATVAKLAPRGGKRSATAAKRRRRAPKPPQLDPVTQYATDVLGGRIVAGRAVRLECQRHLKDLARQRTLEFPYYFDATAAQHIIDFFPGFLTLESGAPFVLPPWLQFCYGAIFGWKVWGGEAHGKRRGLTAMLDPMIVSRAHARRFLHAFIETGKGSGKSPSAGGVGLYGLAFDDEPAPEIYSTGFDKAQASIILNDAIRMAEASQDLADILTIDKYNISDPATRGFFRAMSSQHQSKSGPRPHMVLSDEIHEHRDHTVVSKAEAGFKNRRQPLGLKLTNSGSNRQSYCWQLHDKSIKVAEGTIVDEQWFSYVCHLDPCQKHYDEGYRQPKDGCPDCDDWTDPAVWPKIAPALGIVIQPKYLQDAVDTALSLPSEYALKRRLNFCIWTQTHQVWISPERWDACQVESVPDANPERMACAAGLDVSSVLDLTALVVAIRRDDPVSAGPAEVVEIDGKNEFGEEERFTFTLNFSVELVPFFWIPEETLEERVRNERVPYDVWRNAEKVFATPGGAIDHEEIYRFIVADAMKRFRIQKLGMDENHGRLLFIALQNKAKLGDRIVSVGQGKKLSEAFKFMEILIAKKRLLHDGHPVLAMCMANAEPQRDERTGTLWIEKPSETKRIDGAVAAAMAIHQLMALPSRRRKFGVFSV
jgi:phage terminase large subunit-like protein